MKKNNRYFLYARKSSESSERQVQSIDDQLKAMRNKAKIKWLHIVEEFVESKSAKAPWRYRFNEMIDRIKTWEACGILSWKLCRLSRNPKDTWTIQYMLQTSEIESIITNDKDYYPEDSWLIFSVETWMANQYILDLRRAVNRWLNSKYEKWIRPTKAPLGYMNDKNNYWIAIEDPERYEIIKTMWKLMLTWNYLWPQIKDIVNNELWLRTRVMKSTWGNPLSTSTIYRLFKTVFYTGYFYRKWELIKGIHKPMITLEEYDKVQYLLGKKWNHRPQNYEYAFTWMIKCWECWAMISAEIKERFHQWMNKIKRHTYYHCTKRKVGVSCNQKYITVDNLELQISNVLRWIELIPEFKDWAVWVIKNNYDTEIENKLAMQENIDKTIRREEIKLKKLTDLLLEDIITSEDFKIKKLSMAESIERLRGERDKIDTRWNEVLWLTEEVFDFCIKANDAFIAWSMQDKKNIFSTLGQNFSLKDWELAIELYPWFKVIENWVKKNKSKKDMLEFLKNSTSSGRTSAILVCFNKWSETQDSNLQPRVPKTRALPIAPVSEKLKLLFNKNKQL